MCVRDLASFSFSISNSTVMDMAKPKIHMRRGRAIQSGADNWT